MLLIGSASTLHAYTLPDNGTTNVFFGCLWRDASCTTSSVREDVPTPSDMPQFYLDVITACTTAGYNGGVCALQASKAVAAAETFTTCMVESGGNEAGCKTAADFKANQVTVAAAAPVDPNAPPAVPMQTLQPPTPQQTNQTSQTPAPTTNAATQGDGNLDYTPLEPLPGLNNIQSGRDRRLADMLQAVFRILISLGGFSAVIMLVFGGVTYMMSDVVHKKTTALKRIQAALWGILLLVASWLILKTINPQLLTFELFINPVSNLSGNGATTNTLTPSSSNNVTTLNLRNDDPNRDTTLSNFCRTGSMSRLPGQDGVSTTYTCNPYTNDGNTLYP